MLILWQDFHIIGQIAADFGQVPPGNMILISHCKNVRFNLIVSILGTIFELSNLILA